MGLGKNAKIDINALKRMTGQESTRERLRNKMKENKSGNLKRDSKTGKIIFSTNDGEVQQRSNAEQMKIEADLIAEFETGTTIVEPVKKKKNKGKKGKGKK
jgi:hypothetical protein